MAGGGLILRRALAADAGTQAHKDVDVMLAWIFRIGLVVEVALAGLVALAFVPDGGVITIGLAALIFAVGWLLYVFLSTLGTYALTRYALSSREDAAPPPAWPSLATLLREAASMLAFFALIQPFDRLWLGPDPQDPPVAGRPVVLLVHGYFCNRGLWWWLRRALLRNGAHVLTVNLEPPLAAISHFADQMHARLEAARLGEHKVIVVAHSMGGLVAREYVRRYGFQRVSRIVTMGSPHRGTRLAFLGMGACARDMVPGSPFLRTLESAGPPPIAARAIWSRDDNFIVPLTSAADFGSAHISVDSTGHLSMQFSMRIREALLEEIAP